MEAISSPELKDLFCKCPRLKTKLTGQELSAILETIDKRVKIKHGHLLAKIARLEMYQSVLETKPELLHFSKADDGIFTSTTRRPEEKDTRCNIHVQDKRISNLTRTTFALPLGSKINEFSENEKGDNKVSMVKSMRNYSQNRVRCQDKEVIDIRTAAGNDATTGISKYTECEYQPLLGESAPEIDAGGIPLLPGWSNTDKLTECAIENAKLIKDFTKEIDFSKMILNDRSDYQQILQKSVHQQHLINGLRFELNSKRKEITNLIRDIQRMKYALSYRDSRCNEYDDQSCKTVNDTSRQHENGPQNDKLTIAIGNAQKYDRKQESRRDGCCNSDLVSSQYLLSGCGNPSKCPWKKQLASCRSILAKKYQENASLNFMLIQTQERLSRFKHKT